MGLTRRAFLCRQHVSGTEQPQSVAGVRKFFHRSSFLSSHSARHSGELEVDIFGVHGGADFFVVVIVFVLLLDDGHDVSSDVFEVLLLSLGSPRSDLVSSELDSDLSESACLVSSSR